MAFDSLTDKLSAVFKSLKNKGKLSEADVNSAMREIKMALLSADVNFKVVKEFVNSVSERCVGEEVSKSITPAQQVVKIVNEELINLMGKDSPRIHLSSKPPSMIMMVGLQGAGKTTHAVKIANYFKKAGKRPLLVACDIYRPAAILQLEVLGEKAGIPVFKMQQGTAPVAIAKAALNHAKDHGNDIVLIDTAGRLHIDEVLMNELKDIKAVVNPCEILLTVDAMTGQDAVNIAKSFNEQLEISGVVLTKTDGDTRGGAALSVNYVTGKPIKFIGTGEKIEDLEQFHPERMASRILGMGDILSLIEKAEAEFDEEAAKKLEKKIDKNSLDLEDFLDQMKQMKKLGPLEKVLSMMPGVDPSALSGGIDTKQIDRTEAIILSMTPHERRNPDVLNASRKKRIAAGSGTNVQDINRLLKGFEQTKKLMKQIKNNPRAFKGLGF